MEKMVIHKNKSEIFNCQLKVDGASIKNTVVRLCLEFSNNRNMFFYGKIDSDGNCAIMIPQLKELESCTGKLIVEAIADSTYFKLYESEVEVRGQVEISFKPNPNLMKEKNVQITGQIQTETHDGEIVENYIESPKVHEEVIPPKPPEPKLSKFQKYLSKKGR